MPVCMCPCVSEGGGGGLWHTCLLHCCSALARGSVCLVLQAPAGRLESLTLSPPGEMWAWARNLHVTRTCYPTTPRLPIGTGRRWYVARLGSDPHSLTALGTGGAASRAGSGSHGRGRTLGRWRGTRAQSVLPCPGCHQCWLHWLRRYSPRRRGGPEGTTPEWPLRRRWGGGGGCGLVDGCAREGDGGAVSSAAERHRAADRAEERPGSPGPAPRSAGTNPAEHHPRGRILVEAGGSATPSPRGRTGPGRAPPEGYRGGGRGWAPGLRGPGSWWLWAGAGETGRASGLRLVRGGVEGPGGLGGVPREALRGWVRAPEGGRSLRGGGVAPCPGCAGAQRGAVQGRSRVGRRRGAAVSGRAGVLRAAVQGCRVGPRRSAAWGRVWAWHGAARGRGAGLRRGAAWGCAGAQRGAAHGRGMGLCRGAVAWGCAGAQRGAGQGRSSAGLSRGAAWCWAGAQRGAGQGRSVGLGRGAAWGRAGVQRGAAQGRGVGLRGGAAALGCAGAQRGAARGRGAGLRRGAAAWGCAGARHGAVKGRSSIGLRRGAAWG